MIITEKVKIRITTSNYKIYRKILNSNEICVGQFIEIPFDKLHKGSTSKVEVRCDICSKTKNIRYSDYIKQQSINKIDTCNKCSNFKTKKTCLEKYGVENAMHLDDTKEKIKKTCLEKYGVESSNQSEIVKNNKKNACLEKYGVESSNQSETNPQSHLSFLK